MKEYFIQYQLVNKKTYKLGETIYSLKFLTDADNEKDLHNAVMSRILEEHYGYIWQEVWLTSVMPTNK